MLIVCIKLKLHHCMELELMKVLSANRCEFGMAITRRELSIFYGMIALKANCSFLFVAVKRNIFTLNFITTTG